MIFPRNLEWLIEVLKNPNWEIISSSHLETAVIKLQDMSKNGSRRSAAKKNRIKSTLRSFFKWAFLIRAYFPQPGGKSPYFQGRFPKDNPNYDGGSQRPSAYHLRIRRFLRQKG